MKKSSLLSLPVIVLLLIFNISCKVNVKDKKINIEDLIGNWQLCYPDGKVRTDVFDEEGLVRYKQITAESFMVTHINLNDKKLLGSFWGRCVLENNIYTEYIQYKDSYWEKIPLFKGNTSYNISIKENLLYIQKINGNFKETWVKIND